MWPKYVLAKHGCGVFVWTGPETGTWYGVRKGDVEDSTDFVAALNYAECVANPARCSLTREQAEKWLKDHGHEVPA